MFKSLFYGYIIAIICLYSTLKACIFHQLLGENKVISLIKIFFFLENHIAYIFNGVLLSGNVPNESANGVTKTTWDNKGDINGQYNFIITLSQFMSTDRLFIHIN